METLTATKTKKEIRDMYRKTFRKNITEKLFNQWHEFIADADTDVVKEVINEMHAVEKRLKDYKNSFRFVTRIRKYISQYGYSDVYAYEVVKVCTPKKVMIRALKTEIKVAPKEFFPGGFCGHFADNHAQEWNYESDPTAPEVALFLGKEGWGLGRYRMSDTPYKFHDYNF